MRTKRASVRLPALLAASLLVPAGASAAGKLAFAPASLNFGANALGEIKTLSATLKNTTAANIALGVATMVDNPGGYVIASTTCGGTLGAGQSCKYTLRYTAKTLQLAEARLELTTQNPAFALLKLPLQANRYPALNDTGVTRCSILDANGLTCPVPDYPEQDAQYGRDKTRNVASNGKAGFDYTKLDSRGKPLPASAITWDCVRDNVTGLVWEKRPISDEIRGNQGLHDADDAYLWYSTDAGNNRGNPGNPATNANLCYGYQAGQPTSFCNTEAYVNRVNAAGSCGYTDWRLPNRFELSGLADLSITYPGPTIDTAYFPDTRPTNMPTNWWAYWSSSPMANNVDTSWSVDFRYGLTLSSSVSSINVVRLVRGGFATPDSQVATAVPGQTCHSAIRRTAPDARYIVNSKLGTVLDKQTGLTWTRCLEGRSGTDCGSGNTLRMKWGDALN